MSAELEVVARRGKVALLGSVRPGTKWHVNGADGSDSGSSRGSYWGWALKTLQEAISQASAGDLIRVAPGDYALVNIPRSKTGLKVEAVGNPGVTFIGTGGGAKAINNEADDVTLENFSLEEAIVGIFNRGKRLRFIGGKILNVTTAIQLSLGTAAEVIAGTYGDGSDILFKGTELCWATTIAEIIGLLDFPVTQIRFLKCFLHNITTTGFTSSGPTAGNRFRDLWIEKCVFGRKENADDPTHYLNLNPDALNTGHVMGNIFPVAKASGTIVVSSGMVKSGNHYTDGHD